MEHNKRWRRVKRGKFGRVSILRSVHAGRNGWKTEWYVEYFYLDGMRKSIQFGERDEALESQSRFLAGGKL